jgi:hypothetical protein
MSSHRFKRIASLPALTLVGLALALVPASPAAASKTTPGTPLVSMGTAHVTGTTATLSGSIDPRTFATTYYFQYGPSNAFGQQTPSVTIPAGSTATVKVTQTVSGFLNGYHYRLVADNQEGKKESRERTYTATPPKAKKKAEFVLPKTFEPVPLGGAFALSGTLTGAGNADRAIVLQASPYPYTAPYINVGTQILTGPTGAFSFRVANLMSATKFRVETVGAPQVVSRVVPEQVSVRVTLKARRAGHSALVRLYGTVTPAEVGAKVFIELERTPKAKDEKPGKLEKPEKPGRVEKEKGEKPPTFSTKFNTTVKRATRAISRFSVVISIRQTGHYRAFVQVAAGAVGSGGSSTVLLHVPSTTKKKNKKG